MTTGPRAVVLLLCLLLGPLLGLAACTPASPASPSFAADVGPILAAHCTRCHGPWGDGGAPISDYTTPGKIPKLCYFDAFEDRGDCGGADATTTGMPCLRGTSTCATFLMKGSTYFQIMPPLPAAPLNDWERTMIERWAANPLR
jgi:hypothetical protein